MYTNIKIPDSVTKNEDYAKRASELGHGIISTMEHGTQGRYIEGYELAKKHNLKFLFGTEAYWVKNRLEPDKTNAHICLFAVTELGRQSINDILAEANITGFYGKPRIDLELLLSLSKDDVWVTSACLAFWRKCLARVLILRNSPLSPDQLAPGHNTPQVDTGISWVAHCVYPHYPVIGVALKNFAG
jgi:DNA polymerase III alpha subunit